jgi:hypothetical protein
MHDSEALVEKSFAISGRATKDCMRLMNATAREEV